MRGQWSNDSGNQQMSTSPPARRSIVQIALLLSERNKAKELATESLSPPPFVHPRSHLFLVDVLRPNVRQLEHARGESLLRHLVAPSRRVPRPVHLRRRFGILVGSVGDLRRGGLGGMESIQ